jgi:hypothetical protein
MSQRGGGKGRGNGGGRGPGRGRGGGGRGGKGGGRRGGKKDADGAIAALTKLTSVSPHDKGALNRLLQFISRTFTRSLPLPPFVSLTAVGLSPRLDREDDFSSDEFLHF